MTDWLNNWTFSKVFIGLEKIFAQLTTLTPAWLKTAGVFILIKPAGLIK